MAREEKTRIKYKLPQDAKEKGSLGLQNLKLYLVFVGESPE